MTFSRNQRKRLVLVTTLGLGLLGGGALLKPQWDTYTEKQLQLEAAQAELPPEKPAGMSLPALTLKLEALKDELRERSSSFPVAENVSLLLMQVETIATNEIEIDTFAPTSTKSVALPGVATKSLAIPVEEQRVEIEATGDFTALHRLLGALETYKYPLGVQAIELERIDPPATRPSPGPDGMPLEEEAAPVPDTLKLRMQLSAYMLTKPLEESGLLGEPFNELYTLAQQDVGVGNPFRKLVAPPTPTPPPTPAPLPVMPSAEPLEGWKLEGVLFGPGHVAIVRKGDLSLSLRVGDLLEDWTVTRIEPNVVHLKRRGARKRLALPEVF